MKGLRSNQRMLLAFALVLLAAAAWRFERFLEMRRALTAALGATSPNAIRVLPGFKLSLLHSAEPSEGSWISMTIDPQGRLIVSPETGPLLRLTISQGKLMKIEPIPEPVDPDPDCGRAPDPGSISSQGKNRRRPRI